MSTIDHKVAWLKKRLETMAKEFEQANAKIDLLLKSNREARAKFQEMKKKLKPVVKK